MVRIQRKLSVFRDGPIADVTEGFTDAIRRTKKDTNSDILSYRYHADLNRLVGVFQRHGEFLAKAAAYVLGYVDGTGKALRELSAGAADALSGSYFEEIWGKMHAAVQGMREEYPDGWEDLTVYDDLAEVMGGYYQKMGLELSTTAEHQHSIQAGNDALAGPTAIGGCVMDRASYKIFLLPAAGPIIFIYVFPISPEVETLAAGNRVTQQFMTGAPSGRAKGDRG